MNCVPCDGIELSNFLLELIDTDFYPFLSQPNYVIAVLGE